MSVGGRETGRGLELVWCVLFYCYIYINICECDYASNLEPPLLPPRGPPLTILTPSYHEATVSDCWSNWVRYSASRVERTVRCVQLVYIKAVRGYMFGTAHNSKEAKKRWNGYIVHRRLFVLSVFQAPVILLLPLFVLIWDIWTFFEHFRMPKVL